MSSSVPCFRFPVALYARGQIARIERSAKPRKKKGAFALPTGPRAYTRFLKSTPPREGELSPQWQLVVERQTRRKTHRRYANDQSLLLLKGKRTGTTGNSTTVIGRRRFPATGRAGFLADHVPPPTIRPRTTAANPPSLKRAVSRVGCAGPAQSPPPARARSDMSTALKGARQKGRRPAKADWNGRASC